MELKPGTRLGSGVCATEVIVVKAPKADIDLRCGGLPMHTQGGAPASGDLDAKHSGGTLLGKRYGDPETGLELLCTKAGEGSLSLGDEPLPLKDAKPLPSSD
jgi:hypothetical protein